MWRWAIVASDGLGREAAANLLSGTELEVVATAGPDGEVGAVGVADRAEAALFALEHGVA